MSYVMSVSTEAPPDLTTVLRALGDDVRVAGETPERGWPVGPFNLRRAGVSTRGVEVLRDASSVSARMLAWASPEDWQLAFETLVAAGGASATIEGEDGTRAIGAEAARHFAEVMASETAAAFATISALVAAGTSVELPGPVRHVHMGPRMLRDCGGDAGAVLEAIRRVQHIEDEGFELVAYGDLASRLGLGVDIGGFSVWDPTVSQAFEPAPVLGVACVEPGLYIATESAQAVAGDRFTWLDERHFAIRATPPEELPALIARACEVRVDLHARIRAKLGRTRRKWWQFWKR